MGQQRMVGGLPNFLARFDAGAGGMFGPFADGVAHMGEAGDFVESNPAFAAIAQAADDSAGIVSKVLGHFATAPGAVARFEGGRAVPVEQGGDRFDAVVEELVDQATVKINARFVDLAAPGGDDAGPGDAEAIVLNAEGGHQLNISGEPVVVVAGDGPGFAVFGCAPGSAAPQLAEGVPNAGQAAIVADCTFDLVGGGGGPPLEVGGELAGRLSQIRSNRHGDEKMREIVYSRVNPLLQLMSITLKPEQERIVQAQIQLGKFATPDQAIDLALSLLEKWDELEQFESEWFEETRLKLASASAQIERGEVLDGPTVIAALQTKLNQARAVAECQDL